MSSKKNKSCILTSYLTLKKHPQFGDPNNKIIGVGEAGFVKVDSHDYIKDFHNSLVDTKVDVFIFHDNLSNDFIEEYSSGRMSFIKVPTSNYSNNDFRFFCYLDWLKNEDYENVFMVDLADVRLSVDPNNLEMNDAIFFCQDQGNLNDYKFGITGYLDFHKHFKWENFEKFNSSKYPLLNMGVIGSEYENSIRFLDLFCQERSKAGSPELNINMALGNYVARNYFDTIYSGPPFCSDFKKYQTDRKDVYFIHK